MKIQIIGGSGTGKSTLAQYISEQEKIKWIDTDNYIWKDDSFTENYSLDERVGMYQKDMGTYEEYVASGSIFAWCPEGFNNRDLLVFLSLDEEVRMERLRKREVERRSRFRQTDAGEETNDFLEWCKTYFTAGDKSMIGTYAEHVHQMEISKSPVLKLDASPGVEELYAQILNSKKIKIP